MKNLKERIGFWRAAHVVKRQGGSSALPYECINDWERLFRDRRVLEIGPGEGRQSKELRKLSKEFYVADIVQEVIDQYDKGFLMGNYGDDFGVQFDTITFWYVIHHVLHEEADDFMGFVCRHLNKNGEIFFNFPYGEKMKQNPNGMGTTEWGLEKMGGLLSRHHFNIIEMKRIKDNCNVVVAKKWD